MCTAEVFEFPFYALSAKFSGNREMNQMAAHIDLLPTLSQLCGAPLPKTEIDGRSFVSALEGQDLSERSFFLLDKEVSRKVQ